MSDAEEAIRDACAVHWVEPGEGPKETLDRLLNAATSVALDPLVSEDARALIERGRREAVLGIIRRAGVNEAYFNETDSTEKLEQLVVDYMDSWR